MAARRIPLRDKPSPHRLGPGLHSSFMIVDEANNSLSHLGCSSAHRPQMRHVEHTESLPECSDGHEIKDSGNHRSKARVWRIKITIEETVSLSFAKEGSASLWAWCPASCLSQRVSRPSTAYECPFTRSIPSLYLFEIGRAHV